MAMDADMKPHDLTPTGLEDAEEEHKNLLAIIAAFKYYRTYARERVCHTENYINSLPAHHQEMLMEYRQHLTKIRECIDCNHAIIKKLIDIGNTLFVNGPEHCYSSGESMMFNSDGHEMEKPMVDQFKLLKVRITLKQITRDWSQDGFEEREQCYKPILDEITRFFNVQDADTTREISILVPGAGLGRLTYELAYRGFRCEGNENSLFMLIASNFILNRCKVKDQYTIYPYIHQYVNNSKKSDQVKPVTFPDVSPIQYPTPKDGSLTMIAGDFLMVYKKPDEWDCVVTCFFIDCANNVIEFIERIYDILKPGGIWVNLGPLLYHFSDMPDEGSIEPTLEDLLPIIEKIGFEFLTVQKDVRTKYSQNPRSMHQSEYLSVFFSCKKPEEKSDM